MKKKFLAVLLSLMVVVAFMPCIAFAGGGENIPDKDMYITVEGGVDYSYTNQYGDKVNFAVADKNSSLQLKLYYKDGSELKGELSYYCNGSENLDTDGVTVSESGLVTTGNEAGILYVGLDGQLNSGQYIFKEIQIFIGGYTRYALQPKDGAIYQDFISLPSNESFDFKVLELPYMSVCKVPFECNSAKPTLLDASYKDGVLSVNAKKKGAAEVYLEYYGEEEGLYEYFTFVVDGITHGTNKYTAFLYLDKSADIYWHSPAKTIKIPAKIKYSENYDYPTFAGTYKVKTILYDAVSSSKVRNIYIPKTVTKLEKKSIGYYWGSKGQKKSTKLVIHAKKGTAAYKYAKKYKFKWKKWTK